MKQRFSRFSGSFPGSFLGAVVGLLAGAVVCASAIISQAQENEASRLAGYTVNSFRDYNPAESRFPLPLKDQAAAIGGALDSSPSPEVRKTLLIPTIQSLRTESESIIRGLQDELYLLLGYAYELSGEHQEALRSYDQSMKLRSRNPLLVFRKISTLRNLQRCDEALKLVDELRWTTDVFQHEVLFEKALCQEQLNQQPQAFATLTEIERMSPAFAPAKQKLTQMRVAGLDFTPTGSLNRAVAESVARDLTAKVTGTVGAAEDELTLARILVKKSDPLVNMADLKRGEDIASKLATKSGFQNEQAVRVLFDAQVKRGELDDAERTVTRGLSATPSSTILVEAARQLQILKESQM